MGELMFIEICAVLILICDFVILGASVFALILTSISIAIIIKK
jgi:hypothetical protein